MSINVNGDGNRVAGRDYYELPLKPCRQCEVRFVERDKPICNHCHRLNAEENAKGIASLFVMVTVAVFVWLLGWRDDHGLVTKMQDLPWVMLAAGVLVGSGALLLWLIGIWLKSR